MHPRTMTAITAVTATAGGLALLLNFKTPSTGGTAGVSSPSSVQASTAGAGDSAASGDGALTTAGDGGPQTVTGPAEPNRWGDVQVEVTVDGGRITDASVVQVPSSHGRSVEINDYAVPVLEEETLTAQSADIDMVSGATDTSRGYIASLQAALDTLAGQ
jgi:uncharacterized protein with FMN-binding domain